MAHNLSIREDGMVEMFCAGEAAWHNLGQRTDNCLSWDDAIKTAGIDWGVSKHQLRSHEGALIDAYGIFRDDNKAFLGAVGDRYTPIQNRMMGESLDLIIGQIDGAHYESAGALGKGEAVWAMARIPEEIRVGEDVSEPYLLFSNRHGTGAATIKLTTTRVVCSNTLNIALKSAGSFFRITHHKGVERKLQDAVDAVHGIREQIGGINGIFTHLAGQKMNMEQITAFLNTLFPVKDDDKESTRNKNKKLALMALYEHNDGDKFPEQRGTAFNMLNAVTAYVDHNMSVKGDKGISRSQSALFGAGEALKFFALTELAKMTAVDKAIYSSAI